MRHFKDSSFSLSLTALTSIAKNVFGDPARAQHLYESIHSYGLFQGHGYDPTTGDTESVFEENKDGKQEMPKDGQGDSVAKKPTVRRMTSQMSTHSMSAMSVSTQVVPKKPPVLQPQTERQKRLWDVARERHLNCEVFPYIYAALSTHTWESSSALEDLTSDMPSSALVFRGLRQRIYGVLFSVQQEQRQATPEGGKKPFVKRELSTEMKRIRVAEWCVYKGCVLEEADYVEVMPPPGELVLNFLQGISAHEKYSNIFRTSFF